MALVMVKKVQSVAEFDLLVKSLDQIMEQAQVLDQILQVRLVQLE